MADRNPTDFQEPAGDQPARGLPDDERPERPRRPTGVLIGLGLLAVLVIAVIVAVLFMDDEDEVEPAAAAEQDPVLEDAMTVEEVVERWEELEGQQVTVGGGVGTGLGPYMATIGVDTAGTEQLLLVGPDPEIGVFPQAVRARVTGTIVAFDPEQAEQQLGIELDRDLAENYEGEPALLADSIHYFLIATGPAPGALNLLGQQVTVQSAEVDSVLGNGLVRVAGGQLLVANAGQVAEGDFIEATGTMAVVDDEYLGEQHSDLASTIAGLDDEDRDDINGLPVLVADEVETLDAPAAD